VKEYVDRALAQYDRSKLTLCSIGSHSALEVAYGARAQGLRNLIVTARGRERTYTEHYLRRETPVPRGCVDAVLELETFPEILKPQIQERLLAENAIFLANRSFEVYLHQKFGYDEIERGMLVPFFGNRSLLRAEERDEAGNQYALMAQAGIRHPRQFA
jgi:5-formaminoimidazole-4-carboxamide-1-(beta)-D-ribofuranosyl 5'-monophosphate synthetase